MMVADAGRMPAICQPIVRHGLPGKATLVQSPARKHCHYIMKAEIHPAYQPIKATCSCGNVIETSSTLEEDIHIDVCSNCHPFYTGKQKTMDAGGRVERYRKRFGNRGAKSLAAEDKNAEAPAETAEAAAPANDAADNSQADS